VSGFEFMPRASDDYYRKLLEKVGDSLTADQLRQVEELGLLADKDDQGVLLQVSDRATAGSSGILVLYGLVANDACGVGPPCVRCFPVWTYRATSRVRRSACLIFLGIGAGVHEAVR
jgi:hypothetical protein